YNLDFTLAEGAVAVEVVSGGGNPRVAANALQRREHILNGRHLIEVRFQSHVERVIKPAVVDQLIAFLDEVAGLPAAPGQHRVVRTDGKLMKLRPRRERDAVARA